MMMRLYLSIETMTDQNQMVCSLSEPQFIPLLLGFHGPFKKYTDDPVGMVFVQIFHRQHKCYLLHNFEVLTFLLTHMSETSQRNNEEKWYV